MNWTYVRIISWHVVRTPTRATNGYLTLCGRNASGPVVDALPGGKSCESCTRIAIRSADKTATEGSE